jgi:hypothetical protein
MTPPEDVYALAERLFSAALDSGIGPRPCGHAFAIAQAKMMIRAGLQTEAEVRVAMNTMAEQVLINFHELRRPAS